VCTAKNGKKGNEREKGKLKMKFGKTATMEGNWGGSEKGREEGRTRDDLRWAGKEKGKKRASLTTKGCRAGEKGQGTREGGEKTNLRMAKKNGANSRNNNKGKGEGERELNFFVHETRGWKRKKKGECNGSTMNKTNSPGIAPSGGEVFTKGCKHQTN